MKHTIKGLEKFTQASNQISDDDYETVTAINTETETVGNELANYLTKVGYQVITSTTMGVGYEDLLKGRFKVEDLISQFNLTIEDDSIFELCLLMSKTLEINKVREQYHYPTPEAETKLLQDLINYNAEAINRIKFNLNLFKINMAKPCHN